MPIALSDLTIVDADHAKYDVKKFDCDDKDLNEFLHVDCVEYQAKHLARTKLAYLGDDLVNFFCLSTDSILISTEQQEEAETPFKQIPALKLGRFGTANAFKGKGIGSAVMRYVVNVAVTLNETMNIGCRFVTVDAYPASVNFYEKLGFCRSLSGQYKNRPNVAMYYDIIGGKQF